MERCPCHSLFLGKRIYRYLRGSAALGLHYSFREYAAEAGLKVQAFSDASFAPQGGRSQECFIIVFFGAPIFWKTARQSMVSQSTAESELMAELSAFTAARSVHAILNEVYHGLEIELLVDNAAAVSISSNPLSMNWRTRHLRVRAAGILEGCATGELKVTKVPGVRQIADIGTKVLPATTLKSLLHLLGMIRGTASDEFVKRLAAIKVRGVRLQLYAEAPEENDDGSAGSAALCFAAGLLMLAGAVMQRMWTSAAQSCARRRPADVGPKNEEQQKKESGRSRDGSSGSREVATQSQVTYRRALQQPRFQPLPDYANGAWPQ
jgi:hypothetical protein